MSVNVIIQARMGSSRLPGKILQPIADGYPVLAWIIARARSSAHAPRVVVATTVDSKDDATEAVGKRAGADVWRGSEDDVLQRFVDAAVAYPSDVIAQINGDEPCVDIAEMDRLIDVLQKEQLDYVNNHPAGVPLGTGSEAYTHAALMRMAAATQDLYDHEHVTPYFYRHPELFKQRNVEPAIPHPFASRVRLTLDTPEDIQMLQTLARGMGFSAPAQQPPTNEILAYLEAHPEIVKINESVVQKTFPKA